MGEYPLRPECEKTFDRHDKDIDDITKPSGSIACVHKKLDTKIGLRQFLFMVGLFMTVSSGILGYTYAVDSATDELKMENIRQGQQLEYTQKDLDKAMVEVNRKYDDLRVQQAKDKQEILDAIKNGR